MKTTTTAFFIYALTVATSFTVAENFVELADVPQTATSVNIQPQCVTSGYYPNIMYTIEIADNVTVSTSPANLVTVHLKGNALSFTRSVVNATHGGVKIGLPAGKFNSLTIGRQTNAQILDGFTAVKSLSVTGQSVLTADLSSNALPVILDVTGQSTVTVKSGRHLSGGGITGQSTITVETPSYDDLLITGQSKIYIDGNVDSASVNRQSTMVVSGNVTGVVSNSGISRINARSCGSPITNTDLSTCTPSGYTVSVSVTKQPTIMPSTNTRLYCDDEKSGNTSSAYSCPVGATAAVAAAAYMIMSFM